MITAVGTSFAVQPIKPVSQNSDAALEDAQTSEDTISEQQIDQAIQDIIKETSSSSLLDAALTPEEEQIVL